LLPLASQGLSPIRYRPDIDGLRAFAVIAVIVNHFNASLLPSGYLGVDVFFVISGYVITSSLAKRKSKNFSNFIISFYERRVKRLIPALVAFVLAIGVMICLFNPSPKIALETGISSVFGISNIYLFIKSTDYFSQSVELNPFIHTWSLGVEEQFYLLFPLLVWFSGFGRQERHGSLRLMAGIGFLSMASLLSFIFLYADHQSAVYFLMPFRFWELGAGVLTFLTLRNEKITEDCMAKRSSLPFLLVLGLITVLFLPRSAAVLSTVLVVSISALLISSLSGQSPTLIYKVLSHEKLVSIGRISYSLYLWHWGILAISRWTIGVHWWSVPLIALLIFLMAKFSYRFIENPLRAASWSIMPLRSLGLGTILIGLSGLALYTLKAISPAISLYVGSRQERVPVTTAAKGYQGEFTNRQSDECRNKIDEGMNSKEWVNRCFAPSKSHSNSAIVFVGDSHSGMLMPMTELLWEHDKVAVMNIFNDGCIVPVTQKSQGKCKYIEKAILAIHQRVKGDKIFVLTANYMEPNDFVSATRRFAKDFLRYGGKIVVVAPNPEYPGLATGEMAEGYCSVQWFRPSFALGSECKNGYAINWRRNKFLKSRLQYLSGLKSIQADLPGFFVYDPFDILCIRT
jgi:peptidoglycan/LPS O-acetylase OafA/YrhL